MLSPQPTQPQPYWESPWVLSRPGGTGNLLSCPDHGHRWGGEGRSPPGNGWVKG